jgi:alkylation response protein AidB-like acyl-CoA dehydrogenase
MTALATHSSLDEQATGYATHEVMNQPGALEDFDLYSGDKPLRDAVNVFGADWAADHLKRTGALVGSAKVQYLARQANRHLPEVRTDKCGNKSNASSEVEFYGLHAVMLGEEGRGIRTIIEMAHATRLDFAIGSSGLMRQALSQAIHHTSNRRAFQRHLVDLPIMHNVIADLAVESEAMMWMSMRLARALDCSATDPAEAMLSRIATPVAKYWACKRAPQFVAEALECHGGNGFIADHLMERLYREAPLNGVWEGTGNVICLDALRSMQREPETRAAFLAEVAKARGANAQLDGFAEIWQNAWLILQALNQSRDEWWR